MKGSELLWNQITNEYMLNNEIFPLHRAPFLRINFGSGEQSTHAGSYHLILWRRRDAGQTLPFCPGSPRILDGQSHSSVLLDTDWDPALTQSAGNLTQLLSSDRILPLFVQVLGHHVTFRKIRFLKISNRQIETKFIVLITLTF